MPWTPHFAWGNEQDPAQFQIHTAIQGTQRLTARRRPSFRRDFRHLQLGIHEQREFNRPADGHYVGLRENELARPLPMRAALALVADRGHNRTPRGWCAACRRLWSGGAGLGFGKGTRLVARNKRSATISLVAPHVRAANPAFLGARRWIGRRRAGRQCLRHALAMNPVRRAALVWACVPCCISTRRALSFEFKRSCVILVLRMK